MRRARTILLAALVAVVTLEAGAYLVGRWLARSMLVYVPAATEGFDGYLGWRDPELGWPGPGDFPKRALDARGARIAPDLAADAPECGAAYGDSFTYGEEVGGADAYPHLVSRALGCRVLNFGVGGYGTDQALMRYRRLGGEAGRFVVLGHYTEDIIRNVNQLRDYHSGGRFVLKPRFVLRDGALAVVPLPTLSAEEFARLSDPAAAATLLPYDYFVPGGDAGIVTLRFPFSFRLAMLPHQYRVRAWLAGVPSYEPFYAADHPSGAFDVTLAILAAFDREARARGQSPLVLLIPDVADLWALRAGRALPYAPLATALRARGVETVDAGTELWRRLEGRDPCDLYTRCGGGHLTAEGNAMVAALLARRIRELGLVAR